MGINTSLDSEKLLKALKQFPTNIQKNVMTGAVRAGAKVVGDEVKQNVPIDSGNLKKSIGIVKRRTKNKSIIMFSVTPRKGGKYDGWYGKFLEFGTSKMNAVPFMRPAYENQSNQSIKATKEYLAKRIDKEILKARR